MVIHGEPPPWRKKVKFVGPRLDFEGSLYDDYDLIEPLINFNLDDQVAQRTEELICNMYGKTLTLLRMHHTALLKTVKVIGCEVCAHSLKYLAFFSPFFVHSLSPMTYSIVLKGQNSWCQHFS